MRRGCGSATELAVAATAAAGLFLSFAWTPEAVLHGPLICPFRFLTGLPCPGCGLGRSFVALAHGDLGAAFAFHPFGPLAFALCAAIAAVALLERLTGCVLVSDAHLRRMRPLSFGIVGAWMVWAVLRLSAFAVAPCAA